MVERYAYPIVRYDDFRAAVTPLDPIEDASSWIASLRSQEYTSDVLRVVHEFKRNADIKRLARTIQTYSDNALSFLHQAYSGRARVSYLPLYYAILNLSKITILSNGLEKQLLDQRYHGAAYKPQSKDSHGLLTDTVQIHSGGALPLLYRSLVGEAVGFSKRLFNLRQFYPLVTGIQHEFSQAFKLPDPRQIFKIEIVKLNNGRYVLEAKGNNCKHPNANKLRYLKALREFKSVSRNIFRSPSVAAINANEAAIDLCKYLRRELFYEPTLNLERDMITGINLPISSSNFLMPEEIPIWIAFFHISCVVRYKPEFLDRLENSKCWPVLLVLRKHAIFRYLMLFWSNFHKCNYSIYVR